MDRWAALVTGAGTRLGSQFAMHLADLGYDIALHCNASLDSAGVVAEQVRAQGRECEIFPLDFSSEFDAGVYLDKIRLRFPRLSCLVNSASVYDAAPIQSTSKAMLDKHFKVNFFAPFFLTQNFAEHVTSGQVINIIDNKVAFNQYQYAPYLLSKKALEDFTRLSAVEYAPAVRINGIAPGVIMPMSSRKDDYLEWRREGIPMQRTGEPRQLLSALRYILENEFVCGQILYVDGGESQNIIGRNAEDYAELHQKR